MSSEVLFQEIGLSEGKAKETAKNAKVASQLTGIISLVKQRHPGSDLSSFGMLLYHVASKAKPQVFEKRSEILADYIASGKVHSELRLDAALDYLLKNPSDPLNVEAFEKHCGVGIVVTPEEVERAVEEVIAKEKPTLLEKRYRFPAGMLMASVRKTLPWADGKMVKAELDLQILDILGPKTAEDLAPQAKVGKSANKEKKSKAAPDSKKSDNTADQNANEEEGAATIAELMRNKVNFHKPGMNYVTDGYIVTPNTQTLLAEHLKRTKGKVRTRFPPEPNGLLHIGHAKAININFGYAAAHDGQCILRYDDTNPEKEEEKFFKGIKDIVQWLGYEPDKITHSSDNFQQLYEWAKVLIKNGDAYVCHQKVEDIRGFNPPPSPWRDRSIQESLRSFEDMKNGKFDEGEATLRLKVTLEEGKQDPVAYRIKYAAHHRTGDEWCIYPTYDYTHCLCDSLEDITHSLCTKEFQNRRSSYYWLCNAVNTYCPVQWEYGRLNVNYTVVSKRKIAKLIESGICSDWDDPRLFTLAALRRRGFPPEAINNFCAKMGVTGAQMVVDPSMIEATVRNHLNTTAPRTMVVLEPLKVTLKNLTAGISYEIEVPNFPDNPERGTHRITFGPTIYIEESDFKLKGEKGYRRLTPDQPVGLRYAGFVIKVSDVIKNDQGKVIEIIADCVDVKEAGEKPKAFVHWVSDPLKIEVRLYERLFKHKNPEDPEEVPGGFLSDVDRNSKTVLTSLADKYLEKVVPFDRFQFERIGFFSADTDTNDNKIVFNRTVSLKEDSKKT